VVTLPIAKLVAPEETAPAGPRTEDVVLVLPSDKVKVRV